MKTVGNIDNEELLTKAIKAYLIEEMSYRDIERSIYRIDSQDRGGGFIVMKKLHELGITGKEKGKLKNKSIENEIENANGQYRETLLKYKDELYITIRP